MYSNQAKQTLDLRSLALWARYLLLAKPYFTVDKEGPTVVIHVRGFDSHWDRSGGRDRPLVCEPVGALFNASPEQRMEPFNPCALRGNQRARNPGVVSA